MNKELKEFLESHCSNCKNKDKNLCTITRNISDKLQCVFEEKE